MESLMIKPSYVAKLFKAQKVTFIKNPEKWIQKDTSNIKDEDYQFGKRDNDFWGIFKRAKHYSGDSGYRTRHGYYQAKRGR